MMIRERTGIAYSFEHGDETLPHIKDLVSESADPEKDKILSYLRRWCFAASPGIRYDEITPQKVIGSGNLYADGTYWWNDVFINYVDRYNIPVPERFRTHILKNFDSRMARHSLLGTIDSVEIHNNPCKDYQFDIRIYKNGIIKYENNTDSHGPAQMFINPDEAHYMIDPIMTEIFCYDAHNHGDPTDHRYHWQMIFYRNSEVINIIDGWPDENQRRYDEVKSILEYIERYVFQDIGSAYMKFYGEE